MDFAAVQLSLFAGAFLIAILMVTLFRGVIPAEAEKADRYTHLDGLRGIAAVTVVAAHTNQHLLSFMGLKEPPADGNRAAILAVQMFFGLTAFLFVERALTGSLRVAEFYVSRVRRIVPLYVFACLVTIPLALFYASPAPAVFSEFANDVVNLFTFGFVGGSTLTFHGLNAMALIGIAWTLSYEWKFYVLLPAFVAVYNCSRKAGMTMMVVLAVIAVRDFLIIREVVWPFFAIGVAAAFLKVKWPAAPTRVRRLLSFSGFTLIPVLVLMPGYFSFTHLVLAGVLFICFLYGAPRALKLRPIVDLGRISYSIYLLQYLIMFPLVNEAWRNQVRTFEPVWKFTLAFSVIALLVPFSCFTFRWIEIPWIYGTQAKRSAEAGSSDRTQGSPSLDGALSERAFKNRSQASASFVKKVL